MKLITGHISRCFIAGIVALLPIGGLVLTVVYMESAISGSWLAKQPFYFPGFGLLAVAANIYLIGLAVSTFVGRWLWSRVDLLLSKLPALGRLYQTLKEILGYGEGEDAIFQQVVWIPSRDLHGEEIGLVTNQTTDENGEKKLTVFVPGAPNPTTGRLLIVDAKLARPVPLPVNDALKALVSVGKTPITV